MRDVTGGPHRTLARATAPTRTAVFRAYLERYEKRERISRADSVKRIAHRLHRSPDTLYQWLMRDAAKGRPIPWAMLDVLIVEERLLYGDPIHGTDILALYQQEGD